MRNAIRRYFTAAPASGNDPGRRRVPARVPAQPAGSARITSTQEPGSDVSRSRARWRSLRFTRLRATAFPTALLTTNPTCASPSSIRWRCTTSVRDPAREPDRTAWRNASLEVSRCAFASTGGSLPGRSDGQAAATLAAARRQDAATRAGAHAQAETVHLVAATVVRLIGTLAHDWFSDARSVSSDLSTPGAVGDGPFGRHRPPTESRQDGVAVDMRHRSTPGDRPTVRVRRRQGQTQPLGRSPRLPVDDGLIHRPSGLLGSAADRIDLGPRLHAVRGLTVSRVTSLAQSPADLRKRVPDRPRSGGRPGLGPPLPAGYTDCGQTCGTNLRDLPCGRGPGVEWETRPPGSTGRSAQS